MAFQEMIYQLQYWGILDVLFPFILIFTIIFAIMEKTKPLGEKKNFNTVVALVVALVSISPHILMGTGSPKLANGFPDVVFIINNALPSISVIVVAILMLLIMLGMWGKSWKIAGTPWATWAVFFSIAAVGLSFASSAGLLDRTSRGLRWLPYWLYDPSSQAMLVTILVFAIVIKFITSESKTQEEKDAKAAKKRERWEALGKAISDDK